MLPFYFKETSVGLFFACGGSLIWASLPSDDSRDWSWIDVIEGYPAFCCEL